MKAVIYARVSSKEQEETGYSLDAQEKLLKDYAEKSGLIVKKIFRVSESASGRQIRKTFNEMLQYAINEKVPTLLCEKIDRLTRNLKDAANISDWLSEDDSRAVHFVKESFIVNKNTRAHENLVWDMKVAIARFYTNNLSEEVKKGQKEKLSQGEFPARAKIGYITTGEKGHKRHIIDPEMGLLMRKAFELYSTGNYSLSALVATMGKEGLRGRTGAKVGISRLHKLLSDPFYYGKIQWRGELHQGKHEPLITKSLFEKVQNILNRKLENPQYKKHLPVFKAKIKCEECGGTITWEIQKGHWYGHCNGYRKCSQKTYLRQEKVEDQLLPYFQGIAPKNEKVLKILEKALKESYSDEVEHNTAQRERYTRIIETADKRIEKAYYDKLDGKMPSELCQKVIGESEKEKVDAIESLNKLTKSRATYYEAGFALHELALHAKDIYQSTDATIEEQRLLLSHVFSNLTLNADKIGKKYTLAFEFLTEWMPKINTTFELAESSSTKGKRDAFTSLHPIVLASPV
jgi:site-specific DNA recombinase